MNNEKIPEQHHTQVPFGDFSILLKLNRYLRSVLQGIYQAVIVVDSNVVDHSVPYKTHDTILFTLYFIIVLLFSIYRDIIKDSSFFTCYTLRKQMR